MFDQSHFNQLSQRLPIPIQIAWNSKPSGRKYGHVNALLVTVDAFLKRGATLRDAQGNGLGLLTLEYFPRRVTDRKRRRFNIVGHSSSKPFLLIELAGTIFEAYFNWHLFVEAETTFTQYYPSAAVIVRPRSHLVTQLVRSPGSWGPDIIWMTADWPGTLILESSPEPLTGSTRKNFRGFKLVPSPYKEFVIGRALNHREERFLANNGFLSPFVIQPANALQQVHLLIDRYIEEQLSRK